MLEDIKKEINRYINYINVCLILLFITIFKYHLLK